MTATQDCASLQSEVDHYKVPAEAAEGDLLRRNKSDRQRGRSGRALSPEGKRGYSGRALLPLGSDDEVAFSFAERVDSNRKSFFSIRFPSPQRFSVSVFYAAWSAS